MAQTTRLASFGPVFVAAAFVWAHFKPYAVVWWWWWWFLHVEVVWEEVW